MTGDLSEPVDRTHRESLAAIDQIRQWVAWRRHQVARWEPRPVGTSPVHDQGRPAMITWHLVRTSDDVRQFPVWHTDWHWIVWTYRAVRSDARRRGMARYHAAAWARLSVVRLLLAGAAGHTIGPADTPLGRRRRTKTAAQPVQAYRGPTGRCTGWRSATRRTAPWTTSTRSDGVAPGPGPRAAPGFDTRPGAMDINTIREDLQHLADRLRHELAACERAIAALDGNETPDVVNETSNSAAALQP